MKRELLVISILMALTLLIACSPAEQVIPKTEPVVTEKTPLPGDSIVSEEPAAEEKVLPGSEHQITITADGFSPKTLTVKA